MKEKYLLINLCAKERNNSEFVVTKFGEAKDCVSWRADNASFILDKTKFFMSDL